MESHTRPSGRLPHPKAPAPDSSAAVFWRNLATDLFDRLPLPTAYCTGDGTILCVNTALAAEWGILAGQLRGRNVLDLFHPVTREQLHSIAEAVRLRRRSRYPVTVQWTNAGDTVRHGEMTVDLVSDTPEAAPNLLVMLRSVSKPSPPPPGRAQQRLEADDLERRILALAACGATTRQIASALALTRDGVNYHLKQLSQRWKAVGKTALVARAYAAGLLAPGTWPPAPAPTARQPAQRAGEVHEGHGPSGCR